MDRNRDGRLTRDEVGKSVKKIKIFFTKIWIFKNFETCFENIF